MHPSMTRLYAAAAQLDPPIKGQSALGRAIGASAQTVKNWENRPTGVSAVGASTAQELLGISTTWVLNGTGPMFVGGNDTSAIPVSPTATAGDYVRVEQLDAEADMGDGRINDDYPEVIRAVDYTRDYIRGMVGFVPPPGRLVLITGRGDSMIPTIQPGESLLVDTGINTFDGDGIYLVNLGGGQQVKRLVDHGGTEGVYVHSDNSSINAYAPRRFPADARIGGKVYLRNRIDRFN